MQSPHDKSGYLSEDTIAAVATAVGGAISVIRVSGARAFESLAQLARSTPIAESEPRKLVRSYLYHPHGEILDDALWVKFVSPQSYTGEDLVEYHIHGGQFTAQQVMETLAIQGIRQALPGEFSFRAVRNGKMTLLQAQAVADLISSSNHEAVSLALEKMSGTQNRLITDLASQLRRIATLAEIGIDFADQDVDEVSLHQLQKQVSSPVDVLNRLCNSYQQGIRLQDGVRVAFAGLPNAGKSSFFNALLGEDRSIVSEIAGTTRDVIRERLTLRGKKSTLTLRLEDTAGLRATENVIEREGIERTLRATREADLVLLIVDPASPLEAVHDQWNFLAGESHASLAAKTIGVLTKSDQHDPTHLSVFLTQFKSLGIPSWAITSSKTGSGISDAIEKIIELSERWTRRTPGEVVLTRLDHTVAVKEALEHLVRAQAAVEIDLFASDIRQSLHSLSPLIGETLPDDILGKIFSDFCIGK
jgi:tRNA modification GTPase